MISGMYMGEIVRVLLEHAVKDGNLFGGKGSNSLFTRNMFLTKYVSQIEGQRTGSHGKCMEIFGELGMFLHFQYRTNISCLFFRFAAYNGGGLSQREIHLRVRFFESSLHGFCRHLRFD